MLKAKKQNAVIFSNFFAIAIFLIVSHLILPAITDGIEPAYFITIESVLLLFSLIIANTVASTLNARFEKQVLKSSETKYLQDFIDALRVSYSLDDFYEIVKNKLNQ